MHEKFLWHFVSPTAFEDLELRGEDGNVCALTLDFRSSASGTTWGSTAAAFSLTARGESRPSQEAGSLTASTQSIPEFPHETKMPFAEHAWPVGRKEVSRWSAPVFR
jgi:hypothetical protein